MNNPITPTFDWSTLYGRYDASCKGFDPDAPSLCGFASKPRNDRYLYYDLIERVAREKGEDGFIQLSTYEGILYWKLYSQPAAVKTVCSCIRENPSLQRAIQETLKDLCDRLPKTVSENIEEVMRLFQVVQHSAKDLYGLKNSCALPARSTFLHFLYPNTIPIFDKQVLLAVGVADKNANRKSKVLFEYIQFAWEISKKPYMPLDRQETPIRLLDMALWVIRGKQHA